MGRCLVISAALHGGLLFFIAVLSFTTPPNQKSKPFKPPVFVHLGGPGGGKTPKQGQGAPQVASIPKLNANQLKTMLQRQIEEAAKRKAIKAPPTPAPETPKPPVEKPKTPEPVKPVEKKTEPTVKKVIKKNVKIVEAVETPKPTAKPTPKVEEKPKPKEKDVASALSPAKTEPPKKQAEAPAIDDAFLDNLSKLPASKTDKKGPEIDLNDLAGLPLAGGKSLGTVSGNKGPGLGPGGPGNGPGGPMGLGDSYGYMATYLIQQNFKPPYMLKNVKCLVSFNILKDGSIDLQTIKVRQSTGRSDLDLAAMHAISDTAKLPELYDGFNKPYMEAEITFEYEKQD